MINERRLKIWRTKALFLKQDPTRELTLEDRLQLSNQILTLTQELLDQQLIKKETKI